MKTTDNDNLKHRQLSFWDYLESDTAEREESQGVCASSRMVETDTTDTEPKHAAELLEQMLTRDNLDKALRQVRRNKGAGGVDGMTVEELEPWLNDHRQELIESLLQGRYKPQPVRRVEIPKDNGKKRKLGIPTVVDRLIQQAICQVLSPIFEEQFSDYSYGFRPKRSAHDALRGCQRNITDGYKYVVDMDLEKYFDTVNQSKLIQILSETIKDGRVISLIHKFLKAGVMKDGAFEQSPEGVPQGGPLSPLLGNIMLNECDHELERRGHRYVRYADDMMIFCKSRKAAARTLCNILPFIEGKLFLRVNREKTQVADVRDVKFLGYGFWIKEEVEGRLRVHPKSVKKLKDKIREITGRSNGWSIQQRKDRLNRLITGWVNYFKLADMKTILEKVDGWLRRRLRMVTWKRWKKTKTKYRHLKKVLSEEAAYMLAHTRNKYWYVAGSPLMKIAIPNELFRRAGYLSFSAYYAKERV